MTIHHSVCKDLHCWRELTRHQAMKGKTYQESKAQESVLGLVGLIRQGSRCKVQESWMEYFTDKLEVVTLYFSIKFFSERVKIQFYLFTSSSLVVESSLSILSSTCGFSFPNENMSFYLPDSFRRNASKVNLRMLENQGHTILMETMQHSTMGWGPTLTSGQWEYPDLHLGIVAIRQPSMLKESHF